MWKSSVLWYRLTAINTYLCLSSYSDYRFSSSFPPSRPVIYLLMFLPSKVLLLLELRSSLDRFRPRRWTPRTDDLTVIMNCRICSQRWGVKPSLSVGRGDRFCILPYVAWRVREIFSAPYVLVAVAKLLRATVIFAMAVRLSLRVEQLSSHWTNFHEIVYFTFCRKSVRMIQVSLISGKNNRYFAWRPMYLYDDISLNTSWNEKYFGKIL